MTDNRKSEPKPFPPSYKPGSGKPVARRAVRSLLDELADLVATAYVAERTRWLREQNLREKKRYSRDLDMPTFRKLAQLFVDRQIVDYRTYLYVQFEARANKHIAPTPKQCCGPVALQKWLRFAGDMGPVTEQLATALQIQKKTFNLELILAEDMALDADPPRTREQIVASVLWNDSLQLSGLFRYGAACAANLPEVAATYRDRAYLQYLFAKKAYDKVWGDMVPAALRVEADKSMLNLAAATEALHGEE